MGVSSKDRLVLLENLKNRFENNRQRHMGLEWTQVSEKLNNNTTKLTALFKMEESAGQPGVVYYDVKTTEFTFMDCSEETPKERRSLCYDQKALDSRKENKPKDSAINMAAAMGIDILSEEQYRALQQLGNFDTKTSSWVKTPEEIRKLGGALFCDRRYNMVFVYHNGAESYYAGRAFRGSLWM